MPGRSPKVDHLRKAFLRSIVSAESLYDSVLEVGNITPTVSRPRLHTKHVRRVVELAFLGVIGSWEEFLEQTLVRYIAGAKCDNDYKPILRLGKAADITHAYHLISGDPKFDPAKGFIGLSNPTTTVDMARLFLEGGRPYTSAFKGQEELLADANRLRNKVAHSSTKAREDFKRTARRLLNLGSQGRLTQGYRVGDLLVTQADRHFGSSAAHRQLTFFKAYMEMFNALAKKIVPE